MKKSKNAGLIEEIFSEVAAFGPTFVKQDDKFFVAGEVDCDYCGGDGEVPPYLPDTPRDSFDYCPQCGGTGKQFTEVPEAKIPKLATEIKPKRKIVFDEE